MEVQRGAKRRTIVRVIREKVEDWLASLPEPIRNEVRSDVIVTGGSIASLLLGEPINDFDIYLKTNRSAYILASHYCGEFNRKKAQATRGRYDGPAPFARYYIPGSENLAQVRGLSMDPNARVGVFVKSAGAAGERPEDSEDLPAAYMDAPVADNEQGYEYFETNPDDSDNAERFVEQISRVMSSPEGNVPQENRVKYRPVFMSQNAITLSDKVQIVLRFTGSAQEIHKNFDFTHATCYWEYFPYDAGDGLTLPSAALEAMLSRTLHYSGSKYPICSLFRMRKFINRGWRISAGEITKMAFQISELNLTDINVLRDQLTGVDAAYFHELIKLVKEGTEAGKPIDSTYIINLIETMT